MTFFVFDDEKDPFTYLTPSVELNGSPLITDVTAEQYLQYAARDLEEGTARGAVNALGNAQRALHFIVDSLLNVYGLLARNTRISFPRKLELLDNAGLFSLSILNTLNLERNAMEQEYRVPASVRVQEVTDIARLLLLATLRIGEYVPYECLAGWRADQKLGVVQLDPARGLLSFFEVDGRSRVAEYSGIEVTILERIRTTDGRLSPEVEIKPQPIWEHFLEYKNRNAWRRLLRPLIELSDPRSASGSAVASDGIEFALAAPESVMLPREDRISPEQALALGQISEVGKPVLDYTKFVFGFAPKTLI